ncbi:DNA polymerase delta subunit 3 isoform X2 [Aquarana catesbeiana]|uniref:DNA polymerase delta subunit 3 isoform X2 n=1 Tax=Aquarana catesbeiana TaxID=8400 RepID=UPI003CC9F16B
MDEMYLDNIDELVTDHNKIVTYKWLSHTLGVHVNQAKQMLYDYVTRKRKENQSAQVHVTYLVTGKCVTEGFPYHKVAVVKEEKLEATKSKLALVANIHVYSVQKATLKDSAPLFNTDYDIVKNNLQNCNKFSAIHCPDAVPRSPEVMAQLRNVNGQTSQEVTSTPRINGHASPPVAKVAAPQPKGIMGMFARSAAKPQESSNETKTEPKEAAAPETSSKSSTKSRAMDNFFGKASLNKPKVSPPAIEPVKEEKPAAQPIDVPPPEPKEVKETKAPEKGKKRTIDVPPPEPKEVKETKAPEKGKKRLKRAEMSDSDEEGVKLVKRRRRIKQPRPDSSDEEDEVPVPDVRTPSPPPEPAVKMETETPPQTQPGEKRRKRRRVLKSKQFLDEDGCMVTEKVYESESCTDSGEEFTKSKPAASNPSTSTAKPKTKAETKTSKKAPAASKGTKQASIMGFFQKK